MKHATNTDIIQSFNELIGGNKMFSHYDVTKSIRHKGFYVMHNDVKTVVNAQTIPYNYNKMHRIVKGHGVMVYYPDHLDIDAYNPNEIPEPNLQLTVRHVNLTTPNVIPTITARPIPTQLQVRYDARGRVNIKTAIVRKAGFDVAQKVLVFVGEDSIFICNNPNINLPFNVIRKNSYTVDHHNAIRISNSDIKTAFGGNVNLKIMNFIDGIMITRIP